MGMLRVETMVHMVIHACLESICGSCSKLPLTILCDSLIVTCTFHVFAGFLHKRRFRVDIEAPLAF